MSKAFRAVFQRMVQRAWPLPVGSRRHDGHVDALQRGLLVREVAAGLDRPPDPGVDGLDRVGGADDPADLGVEAEERHELRPGVLPQPHDRRVLLAPGVGELGEPLQCGLLGRRGVDGLEDAWRSCPSPGGRRSGRSSRSRWTTQVWTIVCGQTVSTASGRPLSPSQTSMSTSSTPRFLISVRTCSQYLAPSPPSPAHSPRMSRRPSTVTAKAT